MKNTDVTIISSDCTGGFIYHDLGLQFLSPTINMYFDAPDFMKFIKNLETYLDARMEYLEEDSLKEGYPVAKLNDIKLYLVHYKSVDEAQRKWDERKKRINWSNLFYVMNDRNFCTEKEMLEFDEFLQEGVLKPGVLFTHIKRPDIRSSFYITGCEREPYVSIMMAYVTLFKRRYDQFDWVSRLNQSVDMDCNTI